MRECCGLSEICFQQVSDSPPAPARLPGSAGDAFHRQGLVSLAKLVWTYMFGPV